MGKVDNILSQKIAEVNSIIQERYSKAGLEAPDFSTILSQATAKAEASSTDTASENSSGIPMTNTNSTASTSPGGTTELANENAYNSLINAAAEEYDLDPNFIKSVMRLESQFKLKALSSAGAAGLMQLMPGTAESLGVDDVYNAEQNINGGAKYLRKQLDRFGDTRLALAAYYTGPNRLEGILEDLNITDLNDEEQYNKLPEYIRYYIERVMKNYDNYTAE